MKRRHLPVVALVGAGALLTWPTRAPAEGVWFDIGADLGSYVHESGGGPSWEYFPPFPFGQSWPAGTLVYAELVAVPCDVLPSGCDATTFVAGYAARFDGASCGCGGVLYGSCTLRLYYDANVVARLGADESQLVLGRLTGDWGSPRWVDLDAAIDTGGNFAEAEVAGSISGTQFYGLFRSLPPPPSVRESTWGRIKRLWR